jgi:hypothetical protein
MAFPHFDMSGSMISPYFSTPSFHMGVPGKGERYEK